MEAEAIHRGRVHQGRNVRRTRIEKNINQDVLSDMVHMSQSTVSRYENMKVMDADILERFANALKVPVEYLETLEEDAATIVFENNTIYNSDQAGANTRVGFTQDENDNTTANINPIDKVSELFERLLKEKDERIAMLESRISKLEQKYERE